MFLKPGTLIINSGSKFHRICRGNCIKLSNIVWKTSTRLLKNIDFNTFVKKLNFYRDSSGNCLGQNVRNDRGIISRFHQNSDFDMRLQVKLHFLKKLTMQILFINDLFLCSRQICEDPIFVEYKIWSLFFVRNAMFFGISFVSSRHKGETRIPWEFYKLLSPLQGHIGAKLYLGGLDMSINGKNPREL